MSGCTGSSLFCLGFLLFLVVHQTSHGSDFLVAEKTRDSQTLESSGFSIFERGTARGAFPQMGKVPSCAEADEVRQL